MWTSIKRSLTEGRAVFFFLHDDGKKVTEDRVQDIIENGQNRERRYRQQPKQRKMIVISSTRCGKKKRYQVITIITFKKMKRGTVLPPHLKPSAREHVTDNNSSV